MPNFEVDYSFQVTEYGVITVDGNDYEDVEYKARQQIADNEPDARNIEIEAIRELR